MEPIQNFAQLTAHLKEQNRRKRIAVVCANDPNTEYAITRALEEGIAEFLMIGDSAILEKYPALKQYPDYVKTIHIEDSDEAAREAVRIVREGEADILMKGIINTDNLLRAILDKEKGLLPKGKILTHLAVMEIPTYHKLLFFSDAAVIPRPTLQQRIEMIWYAICTCRHFGIEQPRIALIHCTEKVSAKFPHSLDYVNIVELAEAGEFGNVIIDGPLDVRTACEQASRGHQRNCFAYQRTGGCADFPQYRIGKYVLQVRLPVCQRGYGGIVARTYLPGSAPFPQ